MGGTEINKGGEKRRLDKQHRWGSNNKGGLNKGMLNKGMLNKGGLE